MGILVYDISGGSATAVGVLAALNALPFFLGGMLLAGLGDRFDRRKLLIAVQCVQWLVAVALFLLTVLDMLQLWHLYAAGLVMGVNQTVGFPTQQAFVGDLIPRRQLQEAVGMYSLVFNTCRAIGPALAGYIIAEWGAGTAFGRQRGGKPASRWLLGCLKGMRSGYLRSQKAARRRKESIRPQDGACHAQSAFYYDQRSHSEYLRAIPLSDCSGIDARKSQEYRPHSECGRSRGHGEHPLCSAVCTQKRQGGGQTFLRYPVDGMRTVCGRCRPGGGSAGPLSSFLPVWPLLPSSLLLHPLCSFWLPRNASRPFWGCSALSPSVCSRWRPWVGGLWWMPGVFRQRLSWREGWKPCFPFGC